MIELMKQVEKWGDKKGITLSTNGKNQMLKVVEEVSEIGYAYMLEEREEMIDGIGDTFVTIILLSKIYDIDLITSVDKFVNLFSRPIGSKSWVNEITKEKKYLALIYDLGLLVKGILKNDRSEIEIAINSLVYWLFRLASIMGKTLEQCLQVAWDEIKDRTGKTVDGTFIKESDLK